MKILHTADWHIGQFKGPVVDGVNLRSQDTVKCLEYMVQVAIEEKPDIVCVSGDIFHQEQVGPVRYSDEMITATNIITSLAHFSKYVIVMRGTPNHDGAAQFRVLERMLLNIRNVDVVTEPGVIKTPWADIACLPGFDKQEFRAKFPGLSADEENLAWTKYISDMVFALRAECEKTPILMAHYTVPGCNMESGQTSFFTNFEPVIPRERERAGGGATNRLLTYMADSECPWTPDRATEMMNFFGTNYGHAGVEYIQILNKLGRETVQGMIKTHRDKLIEAAKGQKKTMKQINAMAVLLTADEIAADMLFKDKIKITTEQAMDILDDESVVRAEAQAYDFIVDKIYGNPRKFQGLGADDQITELWGRVVVEDDSEEKITIRVSVLDKDGKETGKTEERIVMPTTVGIFKAKLKELTAEAGVSYEMFIGHLRRRGLIYADAGRDTKKVQINRAADKNAGTDRPRMVKFQLPHQDNIPF